MCREGFAPSKADANSFTDCPLCYSGNDTTKTTRIGFEPMMGLPDNLTGCCLRPLGHLVIELGGLEPPTFRLSSECSKPVEPQFSIFYLYSNQFFYILDPQPRFIQHSIPCLCQNVKHSRSTFIVETMKEYYLTLNFILNHPLG